MEMSKAEYDRIIMNCFNVHGLPKTVYQAISLSVLKNVDKLMNGQTQTNTFLRKFVAKECQQFVNKNDGLPDEMNRRMDRFEKSLSLLEIDINKKPTQKDFDSKANVTSLQRLEERYQKLSNEMVGNQFRATLVFKVRNTTKTNKQITFFIGYRSSFGSTQRMDRLGVLLHQKTP